MSQSLARHGSNWEELAQLDPLWAILSDNRFRYGKWDESSFFASGQQEVEEALKLFDNLAVGTSRQSALDFGCGVGRLSFALAAHFRHVTGVDIAETMIAKAQEFKGTRPFGNHCEFKLNSAGHLQQFAANSFDMVFTTIVLQHVPRQTDIENYIAEFVRIIKPGGMIYFQLPSHIALRHRLQPRRRLYGFLKSLGLKADFLYNQMGIHPIQIQCVPELRVQDVLKNSGGRLLRKIDNTLPGARVQSFLYLATK